jgi:hypothetical protein
LADAYMALHQPQSHDIAAPVTAAAPECEEESVAAVKGGGKKGGQSKYKKKQKQRNASPFDKRRSPLCWLHIRFREKARRCEQPCAWPAVENKASGLCGPRRTVICHARPPVFRSRSSVRKKLLVDAGSAFSIFLHKSASKPYGPLLKAVNGQRIRCWIKK